VKVNVGHGQRKKLRRSTLTIVLLIFFFQVKALSYPNEKRIALVIGNSDYSIGSLANPVNDAQAVSRVLKKAGFSVSQYADLGQTSMKRVIAKFGRDLSSYDVGLFYYAGHAVQVKGRNYLIPVDAKIQFESDIEIETVDLAAVLSKMGGAKNRLNLVILDACRNNPFTSNSRTLNQGLAFTSAPSGTLIAYATAPGAVADDGDGDNGVYTKYLIRHIEIPGKQIEDVFKQVRIDVKRETQGRQVPWESSSLEGDFYFFHGSSPSTVSGGDKKITSGVDKLLRECQTHFSNGRFDKNHQKAQSCYKQVLSQDPTNTAALDGLNEIQIIHQQAFQKRVSRSEPMTLNCSDLREKEAFSGDMGFDDLNQKEKDHLMSHCR
jgi:hypothetical protein